MNESNVEKEEKKSTIKNNNSFVIFLEVLN